jgi:hypothetical protein
MKIVAPMLAVAALLSTFGCAPRLTAVSQPPPTRHADHVRRVIDDDTVRVSRGVAIAFDCYEGFFPESCRNATARTGDKKVAKVFPAYLKREANPYYGYGETHPRAGFVITGVAPGQTTLTVESAEGVQTLTVIVE